MIAAFLYVTVPHLRSNTPTTRVIGIVASSQVVAVTMHAFNQASELSGTKVRFKTYPNDADLSSGVASGTVYVGYLANRSLLVKSSSGTDQAHIFATQVASVIGNLEAFNNAHLTKSQIRTLQNPRSPEIRSLIRSPTQKPNAAKAAYFELILMYILISQYGAWVMLGVIEEKSTRVIEVLLAVVDPIELLTGKIIGIGVVALIHALLLVASLVAGLYAIGSSPENVISGSLLLTGPAYFVIGYAFYCTVFAAVGSTVSRIEDAQAVSFPVALPMIVGYLLGFITIIQSSPSIYIKLAGFIPGISPFLAPILYAKGAISFTIFLITIGISIGATILLSNLAAKIYSASILRIGSRVRFVDLARQIRH